MNELKQTQSDIEIEESSMREVPSLARRIRNALYSAVLGVILVQVLLFFRTFSGSGLGIGASVVLYIHHYPLYFTIYMVVCALMGWKYGQKFTGWLEYEISEWKFW